MRHHKTYLHNETPTDPPEQPNMNLDTTTMIALRIAKAHDALDSGYGTRFQLIAGGCQDMSGIDRRIDIRKARLAFLTYAMEQHCQLKAA